MKKAAVSLNKKVNYVTENYLDKKLFTFKRELKDEILEMREEHKKYKDEVLTKLDDISGQLGGLRDENIIGSGQTSQLREEVDNHESRIKRLEKIQQSA